MSFNTNCVSCCRKHFENVLLTKVKSRRNGFDLYLHDCCYYFNKRMHVL